MENNEQDEHQELGERASAVSSVINNKDTAARTSFLVKENVDQLMSGGVSDVSSSINDKCTAERTSIIMENTDKENDDQLMSGGVSDVSSSINDKCTAERASIKMESTDKENDEQLMPGAVSDVSSSINDKCTAGRTSIFIKEKVFQLMTCSNISEETDKTLIRLNGQSKTLCDRLLLKRHCLQQQQQCIENNKDALKENDRKAFKALQAMGRTSFSGRRNSQTMDRISQPFNACLDIKPLNQLSKKHLESLVGGLQELVCKLTINDKSLRTKVEKLAENINGLQNFPMFMHTLDDLPSTSSGGQRRDSELKRNSRRDSEKSYNGKEKILTPAETFAKYINAMISEYLGDQQKETIKNLKCLPSNIDDLESYSMRLVQAGLGRIVEEEIRINRKNNRQAFVIMSTERDAIEKDAIILLPVARRYAFEGDIVKAFVLNPGGAHLNSVADLTKKKQDYDPFTDSDYLPESDNDDATDFLDNSSTVIACDNCPKAFVISIVKQTELREIVGSISFMKTTLLNSKPYYKLKPHDMKVPMVYIAQDLCKEHIEALNKEDIIGMLYLARVLETDSSGHCIGELLQPIGKVGNLKAEIQAILLHNGLKDLKPYEQKFHDMFDSPMPAITDEDLQNREDLRKKCVFTIDPLTARDLDDAVSLEKLNDEEYEIGVHISDVTHYLEENSELDNLVKDRATSVYLVNEVIHMLPPSLCFRCSLLPGEDKFTFSVFWRWNIEHEVMSEPRFTRSIINSCSQFAYEHAQKFIDNPIENFENDDFPEIFNNRTAEDIKLRVLLLNEIAQKLKAQRYVAGALSINNPKLRFQVDPITGEPLSYEIEGREEANFLIEEFMLLANQSVAKFIHDHFPEISILRNHSPPLQKSMNALKERLANMGLDFNITSSKTIYESMQRLCRKAADPQAMDACLSTLLTKPMARARYFCSEGKTSEADFWHYALSIPIYTHFTSPIRRYPDILVHRLLAAALNYCPPPQRTTEELHQMAKVCNDQKFNAKNAGDESIELFFTRFVKMKQSITLKAVVTDIFKHMLNVVTIETGHSLTITYKLQKVLVDTTNVPVCVLLMEKNSHLPPIKLQLFSTVDINVTLRNDKICGFFVSPDIQQRRVNSRESSKKARLSTSSNYNKYPTANGYKTKRNTNSFSEQDDDNTQRRSSTTSTRRKSNKNQERIYAVNDK